MQYAKVCSKTGVFFLSRVQNRIVKDRCSVCVCIIQTVKSKVDMPRQYLYNALHVEAIFAYSIKPECKSNGYVALRLYTSSMHHSLYVCLA